MKRHRIGIACYPTYGGSGVVATELGIALAERGHDIHVFSYEQPIRLADFHDDICFHQVTVPEYPLFKYPSYNLALAAKMADVVERADLDLLHVHYAIPHAVSALLTRQLTNRPNLKIVLTLHGTDITIVGSDPSYARVTRFAVDSVDAVTAVSTYLKDETIRVFGTTRPIDVVPNFIDPRRYTSGECRDLRALRQKGDAVVMHVSNFRPVKRVADLVRAFAVVSKHVAATLIMIGDGPDRPGAEQLAEELGISSRVRFLGAQGGIERLVPCADLFVLPSLFESFGLAALEAMAAGVPVLASDAGGLPEVIENGNTGVLCKVGDVDCLAASMAEMLLDRPKLKAMGERAREVATTRFTLDRILPQYEAIYERVLAE